MNWRLLLGAAALLVGLAGCGGDEEAKNGGTLSCAAHETICDGACTDLATDPGSCGACGTACGDDQVCADGACVLACPSGQAACDGGCWTLQDSEEHCGACGVACGVGEACVDGACQTACPGGQTACGGSCVDTTANPNHCGACGVACTAGEVCAEGACVASCPAGQEVCDGGCYNLENSRENCGACGTSCGEAEFCIDGACGAACSAGTVDCDGTCRDLESDPAHCGGCNVACGSGERCIAGSCELFCAPGLESCGGACRDLQNDRNHCGGCGIACADGELCQSGSCVVSCGGFADVECDGTCTNTAVDPQNCGGCGIACPAGEVCSNGSCAGVCAVGLATCGASCTDTTFDADNCGSCGTTCDSAPNAAAVCAVGGCENACLTGYGDCNADLGSPSTDGCEVTLGTDPNHCGVCGNACPAPSNATAACVAGICGLGQCDAGYSDCNNDPTDGCEVDVNASQAHCGGCGLACDPGMVCSAGVCSPPGPGENCVDPWVITPGVNSIPTHHAFNDYFNFTPSCMSVGTPEGPDVILKYTATFNGDVTLHFPNKPTSTRWVAMVTEGTCGTPATGNIGDIDIACISDWAPDFMEGTFQVSQGTDYYIHIIDSSSGNLPLNNPLEVRLDAFDCTTHVTTIEGLLPEHGGTTNGLTPVFEAAFADPIDDTTGTVTLSSTGGVNLSFALPHAAVTFSADKRKMTIDPGTTFAAGDQITISWTGLEEDVCGSAVPMPTWVVTAATISCGPGVGGVVGATTTVVPSGSMGNFTEYYVRADTDPAGYVYVGGTTELYRMPKAGGLLESVHAAAGLSTTHLGYDMLIDGPSIYTVDSKTTGTDGHLYRISADGGLTWDPVDAAVFPSVPGGALESLASYGGRLYMLTAESTLSTATELWSIDPSATLPAAATLDLSFGANSYTYCMGLVLDRDFLYTTCRIGSSGSNYALLRVNRTTGGVVELATGLAGSTTKMTLAGRDHDGDGLIDTIYRRANTGSVEFVCSPASGVGSIDVLHTYGTGTSDYGLGLDPVNNVLWLFDDDDNSFVRLD